MRFGDEGGNGSFFAFHVAHIFSVAGLFDQHFQRKDPGYTWMLKEKNVKSFISSSKMMRWDGSMSSCRTYE